MKKNHYTNQSIQPIDVQEQTMSQDRCQEIPIEALYCIAISIKYPMRAGRKKGVPWQDDIRKAIDYLERALSGKWPTIEGS